VKYLNDYATKLELKVQYNTNITVKRKQTEGEDFVLKDQRGNDYICTNVIMRYVHLEGLVTFQNGCHYTVTTSTTTSTLCFNLLVALV